MAGRAGLLGLNAPVLLQQVAEFLLSRDSLVCLRINNFVLLKVFLSIVVEVVNFLERTKVILWSTVAVQTEIHAQWLSVIHFLHLIDLTVAALTRNAAVHVSGVIEIGVVWSLVNANPLDRLFLSSFDRCVIFINTHRSTQWRQLRVTFLHVLVTVPTCIGCWDTRTRRLVHRAVTVTAVDTELIGMQIMIIRNRLIRLISYTLGLRRAIISKGACEPYYYKNHTYRNLER